LRTPTVACSVFKIVCWEPVPFSHPVLSSQMFALVFMQVMALTL
jgi:hypothetical protein